MFQGFRIVWDSNDAQYGIRVQAREERLVAQGQADRIFPLQLNRQPHVPYSVPA